MDRFQYWSKEYCCHQEEGLIITQSFQEKMLMGIWWCHIYHALLESSLLWFHKILKSIFHKQISCSKKYVPKIENKLPNSTPFSEIFWYFWNNDSVEHMLTVVLTALLLYIQGKISLSLIWWIRLFWILTCIYSRYFTF